MENIEWYSPSQVLTAKHVSYPQLTATVCIQITIIELHNDVILVYKGCGAFSIDSVVSTYNHNVFLECQEWAQCLAFTIPQSLKGEHSFVGAQGRHP